jgi:hypothetical protein
MAALVGLFHHAHRARLATHLFALGKLLRHPETPWAPKLLALFVLAQLDDLRGVTP